MLASAMRSSVRAVASRTRPIAAGYATAIAKSQAPKDVPFVPEIAVGLAFAGLGCLTWGALGAWPTFNKIDNFNKKLRDHKHGMSYKAWKGERLAEDPH